MSPGARRPVCSSIHCWSSTGPSSVGGGVGYTAPASLGAALANKEHGRITVSFNGDGDLMMSPGVLWTAAHHELPILYVVHNNRAYHQEYMHVQRIAQRNQRGIDRAHIGTTIDNPNINFAGLAKALDRLCSEATDCVLADRNILILSDRAVSAERVPIPALLATAAVHHYLIRRGLRTQTGLVIETGEALVSHPHVAKICFTGGEATGSLVYQTAAKHLKPVTMELGGKSANIVFADAKLDNAVKGVVSGIFAATGQTCVAGSRALVHRSIHDEFVERFVTLARTARMGDPLDERACLLPWPNDAFTVPDAATPTGRRLDIHADATPLNAEGTPIDPGWKELPAHEVMVYRQSSKPASE